MDDNRNTVLISNGALTAGIDPFGAELLSLKDAAGREYMTDADPAFWTGHAPLLFPIVGRLKGDVLRFEGHEYRMLQHGFARRMLWTIIESCGEAASFRLADDATTRAQYPFGFEMTVRYALVANRLAIVAQVRNPGDRTLPFSLGFHPAFAWPLPDGGEKKRHMIVFDDEEPRDICRLDDDGLLAFREKSPVVGNTLALDPALFVPGALIWVQRNSRGLTYRSPEGPWLEIRSDLPQLGLWQKPGANFICIEPWAGLADAPTFAGEFQDRFGLVRLPPKAERQFSMDVAVHPPEERR